MVASVADVLKKSADGLKQAYIDLAVEFKG